MTRLNKLDKAIIGDYGKAEGFLNGRDRNSFFFSNDILDWIYANSYRGNYHKAKARKVQKMDLEGH